MYKILVDHRGDHKHGLTGNEMLKNSLNVGMDETISKVIFYGISYFIGKRSISNAYFVFYRQKGL